MERERVAAEAETKKREAELAAQRTDHPWTGNLKGNAGYDALAAGGAGAAGLALTRPVEDKLQKGVLNTLTRKGGDKVAETIDKTLKDNPEATPAEMQEAKLKAVDTAPQHFGSMGRGASRIVAGAGPSVTGSLGAKTYLGGQSRRMGLVGLLLGIGGGLGANKLQNMGVEGSDESAKAQLEAAK